MTAAQSTGLPPDLVDRILDPHAEDTAYVERKLSLRGSGPDRHGVTPADPHEEVIGGALAVANANMGTQCYLVFGQDDRGNVVGEVSPDGSPLSTQQAAGARRSLSTKLGRLGMPLSWHWVDRSGKKIWIASFTGRSPGGWFTDASGRVPLRTGGETVFATVEQQRRWLAEPAVYISPKAAAQSQRQRIRDRGRFLDLRPIGVAIPKL